MERRRFFGLLPFLAVPAVFEKKEEPKRTLEDKAVKATQIMVTDENGEQYHLLAVKKDEEMNTIAFKPPTFGIIGPSSLACKPSTAKEWL